MNENHYEKFSSLITSIYGSMQKIKNRHAKSLDLKPVHIFWIYLFDQYPEGLSASDLARKSKTNRSLISREISFLLENEILRPEKNKQRTYGEKMLLTDKGKRLAEIIDKVSNSIQEQVSSEIDPADLENFYRVFEKLSENFEEALVNNQIQQILNNASENGNLFT